MDRTTWFARVCLLLALLAILVGSTGGSALAQDTPGDTPSATGGSAGAVSQEEVPQANVALATSNFVNFSSMNFQPNASATQYGYSFTYGTQFLTGGSFAEFFQPLTLPDGAEVREITAWFRDNNASVDPIIGLCRVANGMADAGCVIQFINTASNGNTGNVVVRSATGTPITVVNNASYNYFLVVGLQAASDRFGLVSIRVGYGYPSTAFLPTVRR